MHMLIFGTIFLFDVIILLLVDIHKTVTFLLAVPSAFISDIILTPWVVDLKFVQAATYQEQRKNTGGVHRAALAGDH